MHIVKEKHWTGTTVCTHLSRPFVASVAYPRDLRHEHQRAFEVVDDYVRTDTSRVSRDATVRTTVATEERSLHRFPMSCAVTTLTR